MTAKRRRRVVVVGAGAAGCAVAATLTKRDIDVVLVEGGPSDDAESSSVRGSGSAGAAAGPGYFSVIDDPTNRRPATSDRQSPYVRGHGLGGSGRLFGGLLQPGRDEDFDQWASTPGCTGWDAASLRPYRRRALELGRSWLRRGAADDIVASAAASSWIDLVLHHETSFAVAPDGVRTNSADWTGPPLHTIFGRSVSILANDGVVLDDGSSAEADVVVCCAGTVESPRLLYRSGIDRRGIGENLHDHPALVVSLPITSPPTGEPEPVTSLVGETADGTVQIVPLNRTADQQSQAALLAIVMHQEGRGKVSLGPGVAHLRSPANEADAASLRRAGRLLANVARHSRVDVSAPDVGASDEVWDEWCEANAGPVFHAAGTCRMGSVDDESAVVDDRCEVIGHRGLFVIDASVFPNQPRSMPFAPTVAVALRAADALADRLT